MSAQPYFNIKYGEVHDDTSHNNILNQIDGLVQNRASIH